MVLRPNGTEAKVIHNLMPDDKATIREFVEENDKLLVVFSLALRSLALTSSIAARPEVATAPPLP